MPIYEPGLEELVVKNVKAGRLQFTSSTQEGVEKSDVIFIAVPTPAQPDGSVDLSFIEAVSREIAAAMTAYKIIVDKSTVPVKTGEKVAETIKRYCKAKVDFDVVSNPEFLREGFAVDDFMKPDRVVIGTASPRPVKSMQEVYAPYNAPIIVTDINSAELIKHAANSFLALKISYINAISVLCERSGANVQEVANGMGMDVRIGRKFLDASLGFGGSCFPKDLSAFIHHFPAVGLFRISACSKKSSKSIPSRWIASSRRLPIRSGCSRARRSACSGWLSNRIRTTSGCRRRSSFATVCKKRKAATLRVYDPQAMEKAKKRC